VAFRAVAAGTRELGADMPANPPEEHPCPGELETQNGKSHRYDHQCGPRRYEHDDTREQDRGTHDGNHDAPRQLVGQVYGCFHPECRSPYSGAD